MDGDSDSDEGPLISEKLLKQKNNPSSQLHFSQSQRGRSGNSQWDSQRPYTSGAQHFSQRPPASRKTPTPVTEPHFSFPSKKTPGTSHAAAGLKSQSDSTSSPDAPIMLSLGARSSHRAAHLHRENIVVSETSGGSGIETISETDLGSAGEEMNKAARMCPTSNNNNNAASYKSGTVSTAARKTTTASSPPKPTMPRPNFAVTAQKPTAMAAAVPRRRADSLLYTRTVLSDSSSDGEDVGIDDMDVGRAYSASNASRPVSSVKTSTSCHKTVPGEQSASSVSKYTCSKPPSLQNVTKQNAHHQVPQSKTVNRQDASVELPALAAPKSRRSGSQSSVTSLTKLSSSSSHTRHTNSQASTHSRPRKSPPLLLNDLAFEESSDDADIESVGSDRSVEEEKDEDRIAAAREESTQAYGVEDDEEMTQQIMDKDVPQTSVYEDITPPESLTDMTSGRTHSGSIFLQDTQVMATAKNVQRDGCEPCVSNRSSSASALSRLQSMVSNASTVEYDFDNGGQSSSRKRSTSSDATQPYEPITDDENTQPPPDFERENTTSPPLLGSVPSIPSFQGTQAPPTLQKNISSVRSATGEEQSESASPPSLQSVPSLPLLVCMSSIDPPSLQGVSSVSVTVSLPSSSTLQNVPASSTAVPSLPSSSAVTTSSSTVTPSFPPLLPTESSLGISSNESHPYPALSLQSLHLLKKERGENEDSAHSSLQNSYSTAPPLMVKILREDSDEYEEESASSEQPAAATPHDSMNICGSHDTNVTANVEVGTASGVIIKQEKGQEQQSEQAQQSENAQQSVSVSLGGKKIEFNLPTDLDEQQLMQLVQAQLMPAWRNLCNQPAGSSANVPVSASAISVPAGASVPVNFLIKTEKGEKSVKKERGQSSSYQLPWISSTSADKPIEIEDEEDDSCSQNLFDDLPCDPEQQGHQGQGAYMSEDEDPPKPVVEPAH